MDGEETTNTELIFETWLYKLRGNVGEKRLSHYLSGAWNKKYFVLVREGNKPKIFYYNKRPKDYLNAQKGIILLDHHYHVDQKPAEKGKAYVFQLTTALRNVLFAVEKEQIYDLLMFFLRTQIRLREDLEGECFIVRPERSEDHRRIGAQSAMCLLHVSQWGLTLALQLSKSVLAQWPLRCIRWYECSGRGRFAIETGSHASTGSGRYVFKTRVSQDSTIYDRIDTLVNEQAKMQGMVKARVSNCSGGLEACLSAYDGLDRLTEVKADSRFISHLKKIARDIYDHLSEHLGERSGLMTSWNSALSTVELISGERNCSVASAHVRSLPLVTTQSQSAVPDTSSVHHGDDEAVLTSQYLHMGTPVFDTSPFNNDLPSFSRSTHGTLALGSRVDYSLEQFIEAPEYSGFAEVYGSKQRAVRGSGLKQKSSSNCLRLKSFSLDDLSNYIGSNERAVSYTNSVFQNSGHRQEASDQVPSGWNESDINPYSYATTPDFGFLRTAAVKSGQAGDNDGYCRPRSEVLSKTLSDPNLLEENGVYHRVKPENRQNRGSQVRSIRHVLICRDPTNRGFPQQIHSKADDVSSSPRNVGDSLALGDLCDDTSAAHLPRVSNVTETVPSLTAGISMTPKTRVFTKQKSLGSQLPNASHATSRPSSTSLGPPLMLFHAARRPDRGHGGQLPSPPADDGRSFIRVPLAAAKETTSFA